MLRRFSALALVAALLISVASPALAAAQKSGTQNCGYSWVWVQSYAKGQIWHYTDGHLDAYWNQNWAAIRRSNSHDTYVYWLVSVNGTLWDSLTYAYCSGGPG